MRWDRLSACLIHRGPLRRNTATSRSGLQRPVALPAPTSCATRREEDGTGLNYYRARYYHPQLQRFISEDPIGFAGGDENLYAYVFNEPTDPRDPSGLEPITISTGAALAIVCAVGAVAGDVVVLTVSGRKTTWAELAGGAAIGCVGGVGVLAGYAAVAGPAVAKVGTGIIVTAGTMREALLKAAQHPALQKAIDQLYRPGAKIGDGGTADMARQELHKVQPDTWRRR